MRAGILESLTFDFSKIEMRLEFSDYGDEFMIDAPNVDAAAS